MPCWDGATEEVLLVDWLWLECKSRVLKSKIKSEAHAGPVTLSYHSGLKPSKLVQVRHCCHPPLFRPNMNRYPVCRQWQKQNLEIQYHV